VNIEGVKLDKGVLVLGCGNKPYKDAMNHDRDRYTPDIDVAWDLNLEQWPVEDNRYWMVIAEDVVEHLDSFIHFMDECWRIIEPNGRLIVQVPRWDSENTWRDPTHKRGYHVDSFRYLDPDTFYGKKYGMYTDKKWRIEELIDGDNILSILIPRKGRE
jgi:2-polyprenyl-3-methyl-5-hydroxy-6-metoxy-1,4-benzoquinol methylase